MNFTDKLRQNYNPNQKLEKQLQLHNQNIQNVIDSVVSAACNSCEKVSASSRQISGYYLKPYWDEKTVPPPASRASTDLFSPPMQTQRHSFGKALVYSCARVRHREYAAALPSPGPVFHWVDSIYGRWSLWLTIYFRSISIHTFSKAKACPLEHLG